MIFYSFFGVLLLIVDIAAIASVLAGYGTTGHKVLWTVLIFLFPLIGAALYFLVGRDVRDAPI